MKKIKKKSKLFVKVASVITLLTILLSAFCFSSSAAFTPEGNGLPEITHGYFGDDVSLLYTQLSSPGNENDFPRRPVAVIPDLGKYYSYDTGGNPRYEANAYASYNIVQDDSVNPTTVVQFYRGGYVIPSYSVTESLISSGLAFAPAFTLSDSVFFDENFFVGGYSPTEYSIWFNFVVPYFWDFTESSDIYETFYQWYYSYELLHYGDDDKLEWVTVSGVWDLQDYYSENMSLSYYFANDMFRSKAYFEGSSTGLKHVAFRVPLNDILADTAHDYRTNTGAIVHGAIVRNASFTPMLGWGAHNEHYLEDLAVEVYNSFGTSAQQYFEMQFEPLIRPNSSTYFPDRGNYYAPICTDVAFSGKVYTDYGDISTNDIVDNFLLSFRGDILEFDDLDFTSWIGNSLGAIMDVSLIGPISLSDILLVVVGIFIVIMVLKIFAGG